MWTCKYASVQVCKYASVQVCKCASVQVCKCASVQVCKFASVQEYKCASVQVCMCASVQVCKCASVQVCKCASVQVCKCACVHVCKYMKNREYIEIELSWVDLYEFVCLSQLCTYVLVFKSLDIFRLTTNNWQFYPIMPTNLDYYPKLIKFNLLAKMQFRALFYALGNMQICKYCSSL